MIQGCQFCFVPFKMTGISCSNLKNGTNQKKFHLTQNLSPFHKLCQNFGWNVSVPFQPNNVFFKKNII